ncbi:MAG: aldo/keto reductase [Armatimonadetes bacterium]|nr:aldo/keto reductase [Armatimonadota bacterium]
MSADSCKEASVDRREFIKTAAAAGLAAALTVPEAESAKGLPRRKLGKAGERLSIIGFGGIVVSGVEQPEADRLVREAVQKGVNYFDVAPTYGNAEERLGPALKPYRDKVFLACKTVKRDKEGAAQELAQSLERLKTDHVDLYQLHAITTLEDVEKALGPGGAIEAVTEARKRGQVRYIGFSAHSVEAALKAMNEFKFDTILFPFNYVCFFQGDFGPQVLKAAREKGMGCLALKAMARTHWPKGAKQDYPKCWYQPVSEDADVALALRFTLSQPITAAVPPGDARLFEKAVAIAQRFKPITAEETRILQAKAEGVEPIFHYPQAQG